MLTMPRLKARQVTKQVVKIPATVNTPKRGRGRPRKTTSTESQAKVVKRNTRTNALSQAKVVNNDSKLPDGMDIDSQAVRWKVVKLAWKFSSDTEVARLLLDW